MISGKLAGLQCMALSSHGPLKDNCGTQLRLKSRFHPSPVSAGVAKRYS